MNRPPFFRRAAGFTLLEMVITLSIFILLAGAVFGILTGVLQGSSRLRENQDHHDQIAALNAYLKKQISEMTALSVLSSYRRGEGEGLIQNGIMIVDGRTATVIDAKVQSNGYYTLRATHYTAPDNPNGGTANVLEQALSTDDPSLQWATLVRDVKTVHWEFWDNNNPKWQDFWRGAAANPDVLQFTLQFAGDDQAIPMDFWIPHIDAVQIILVKPQASH